MPAYFRGTMIKTFRQYLREEAKKSAHIFDVDETTFTYPHEHDPKIHLVHTTTGKRVASFSNMDWNGTQLPHDHRWDFSDFTNASLFQKGARPIRPVVNLIKKHMKDAKENPDKMHVAFLTARDNLDDVGKTIETFGRHGINIQPTGVPGAHAHLHRSGEKEKTARLKDKMDRLYSNEPPLEIGSAAEGKLIHLLNMHHEHGVEDMHMYDDNPEIFKTMKEYSRRTGTKSTFHHVITDTTGTFRIRQYHFNGKNEE